jgi:hypothetical protein
MQNKYEVMEWNGQVGYYARNHWQVLYSGNSFFKALYWMLRLKIRKTGYFKLQCSN